MRRGAWASVLAVLALAVAGCSEPEQPSTSLPTAASTSAEPTLEPLGPADFPVPPEAREQTDAGAEQAARYYLELTSRSLLNLDSSWLRSLSEGCEQCTSTADNIDAAKQSGNSYAGGLVAVTTLTPEPDSEGRTGVGLLIEQDALQLLGPDGAALTNQSLPARRLTGGVVMSWDLDRSAWLINQLDLSVS